MIHSIYNLFLSIRGHKKKHSIYKNGHVNQSKQIAFYYIKVIAKGVIL